MAGKFIKPQSSTFAAADHTGYATLSSVDGWYEKAIVWLSKTGTYAQGIITEVDTTNKKLGIKLIDSAAGTPATYGRSDINSYDGGTITQQEQLIYNSNDKPLD